MRECICVCLSQPLLANHFLLAFHSADTNNDRFLDPIELEALFFKEVQDIYGDDRDQMEIREEMSRMREHVLEEVGVHPFAWSVACVAVVRISGENI